MKDRRNKYGFAQINLGEAYAYYGVSAINLRSAATLFGQRHKMKFRVKKDQNSVLVHRIA